MGCDVMKKFYKEVSSGVRDDMIDFLENHFRYNTMNSNNNSTSYANNVKLYNLDLSKDLENKAYSFLDVEEVGDMINQHIRDFQKQHDYSWTAGFNGRSNGYLVLYKSERVDSGYKSVCLKCCQLNYKSVPESDEFGKCGRCGEMSRVNLIEPIHNIRTFCGTDVDQCADFEDWANYNLQQRVELVQSFDKLCDDILADFVSMLGKYDIGEETIYCPMKVKTLVPKEE